MSRYLLPTPNNTACLSVRGPSANSKIGLFILYYSIVRMERSQLVQLVDYRWNQLYTALYLIYQRLLELGLVNQNGEVVYADDP